MDSLHCDTFGLIFDDDEATDAPENLCLKCRILGRLCKKCRQKLEAAGKGNVDKKTKSLFEIVSSRQRENDGRDRPAENSRLAEATPFSDTTRPSRTTLPSRMTIPTRAAPSSHTPQYRQLNTNAGIGSRCRGHCPCCHHQCCPGRQPCYTRERKRETQFCSVCGKRETRCYVCERSRMRSCYECERRRSRPCYACERRESRCCVCERRNTRSSYTCKKRREETKALPCPELEIFFSDPPKTDNNHRYAKEVWSCLTGKGQLLRRRRSPIGRKRLNILIHDPPGDPGKVFLEMGIPGISLLERMFSLARQGFEDGRTAVESILWGEQHSDLD